ncbi:hypothetical protein ANN_06005 [Periplaneta americana]|uniref:Uncharacterized protein n=1 Tax=Periplaneta americana TaxID=6978 RepID=A0ABQ8TE43_PERAM|nr:hypothetical protein ANN_06005 [Periplaneta americana]
MGDAVTWKTAMLRNRDGSSYCDGNDDIAKLVKDKKAAYLKYLNLKTDENLIEYKKLSAIVSREVRKIKRTSWEKYIGDIEHDVHGRQDKAYKILKHLNNQTRDNLKLNLIPQEEWTSYFKGLWTEETDEEIVSTLIDENVDPISFEELETTINNSHYNELRSGWVEEKIMDVPYEDHVTNEGTNSAGHLVHKTFQFFLADDPKPAVDSGINKLSFAARIFLDTKFFNLDHKFSIGLRSSSSGVMLLIAKGRGESVGIGHRVISDMHDVIRLLIPALYKNQSDSLMAADGDCHHLCKLMAPVRHRWSINDVIGGIRNTVMPSDCSPAIDIYNFRCRESNPSIALRKATTRHVINL